jgi:hypothetical protein
MVTGAMRARGRRDAPRHNFEQSDLRIPGSREGARPGMTIRRKDRALPQTGRDVVKIGGMDRIA